MGILWQRITTKFGSSHCQNAQTLVCHSLRVVPDLFHFCRGQAAKLRDCRRRSLAATTLAELPGVRQTRDTARQPWRQWVFAEQFQVTVQVFGVDKAALAQLLEGKIHRVERLALAGQDAEFHQFVKEIWEIHSTSSHPQHMIHR